MNDNRENETVAGGYRCPRCQIVRPSSPELLEHFRESPQCEASARLSQDVAKHGHMRCTGCDLAIIDAASAMVTPDGLMHADCARKRCQEMPKPETWSGG